VFCGDGLVTGNEKCDDGNTNDGDGCQGDCKSFTPGWSCSSKLTLPSSLDMRITFRDFKSASALAGGGHPDFQYNTFSQVLGITGDACTSANAATCGRLDAEGKPVLIRTGQQNKATGYNTGTGIMSADTFGLWYRDTNPKGIVGYNGAIGIKTFSKTLTLTQQGGNTSQVYSYTNGNFYPLTAAEGWGPIGTEVAQCNNGAGVLNQANNCNGCDANCMARDYGFSSELRYFFQYQGGERLSFTGDDDVWVYVNGKLAVDLGGLHSQLSSQVVLGDDGNGVVAEDSNCSLATLPDPTAGCYTTAEHTDDQDKRFGLTKGGVYEIVLFHAERHSSASNFKLTLAGFLAPRSSCDTICGDGIVAGTEYCDDGVNNSDTASGACNTSCTARAYCGDGVRQLSGEACDDGTNITLYKNPPTGGACAPGCKLPANCGDGVLQAGQGELCDLGAAQNTGAYGGCTSTCKLGGYCGDGVPNGDELCDLGANNGKTYGAASCGYDCKPGPHCGDGIPNDPSEECDKGALNGQAGSGCDANCKSIPGCGDGKLQTNLGEQCDYGQFASNAYGGCTNMCSFGPHCGDADVDSPYEECDDGANNNDTTYDGCTTKCALGPHCGDAVLQSLEGEVCDNGFNDDDYQYPSTSCGPDCMAPPGCGDGVVQPAHELCDAGKNNSDTAYNGCTTSCVFGPYCGDGHVDPQGKEACDKGAGNVAYAAKQGGCSYDCQPAPYCGDGTRNGPEQCDLGAKANTGEYGGCNADCTFAPRCGDGVKQADEQCDDGPVGSLTCSTTCKRRVQVQ
jgi:fibro-slime domain-containing protein